MSLEKIDRVLCCFCNEILEPEKEKDDSFTLNFYKAGVPFIHDECAKDPKAIEVYGKIL